ncbi:Gfo/Idh/MocA family oxidoreductase [Candidatus Methylomirabilis sp.]|uniref:Gfo/Idh/MocA family protein n=1 Tax=Candidatus Methylomirabilis sp. TaxID=2032687 RepID=UPI0030761B4B
MKRTEENHGRSLNIAIIGCGRIGEREASAVVSIPDLRLVAVSDVGPAFREKALRMGEKYECDAVHEWRHLVTRDDVNIVIVSTPTTFHKDMSIEAMKHGKHVICEKPLAGTPEDAEEMLSVARAQGVKLMTNFNHRRHDHIQRAKEIVDRGLIGCPVFIRGRIGHGRFIVGPSPSNPERFQCQNTWYTDITYAGGGALIDNGVHLLDLARWFMDDEFVEAQGYVTYNLDLYERQGDGNWAFSRQSECEDNAFGLFKTKGGRVASIHSSWVQWQGYLYLEIFGTNGSVVINSDQIQGHVSYSVFNGCNRHGDPIANIIEVPALLRPDPSWKRQLQEFVAAIREDREPSQSGYDGLQAMRMVQAVYDSAGSGKTVPIEAVSPSLDIELSGIPALR